MYEIKAAEQQNISLQIIIIRTALRSTHTSGLPPSNPPAPPASASEIPKPIFIFFPKKIHKLQQYSILSHPFSALIAPFFLLYSFALALALPLASSTLTLEITACLPAHAHSPRKKFQTHTHTQTQNKTKTLALMMVIFL
jgi:hypothetical protein